MGGLFLHDHGTGFWHLYLATFSSTSERGDLVLGKRTKVKLRGVMEEQFTAKISFATISNIR